jgi:hypothetical protein
VGTEHEGTTYERTGSETYAQFLNGDRTIGALGVWVHVSAPLGHQGPAIRWTLEIRASRPVRVYPRMAFGKLLFLQALGATASYQHHGLKYRSSQGIETSRPYEENPGGPALTPASSRPSTCRSRPPAEASSSSSICTPAAVPKLQLHTPLGGAFWPEVTDHPLAQVTTHELLTHTAGLPLRTNLKNLYGTDPQDIRDGVLHDALHRAPSEAVEYTDRAGLILGYLAEHLGGKPFDSLVASRIWEPLGMTGTGFGPLPTDAVARCAPTELEEETGTHIKGIAHDLPARLLGGTCGIAGTFSTVTDLGRFLRHMLAPAQPAFGRSWISDSLRVRTGELTPTRPLPAPGTRHRTARGRLGPLRLHRHRYVGQS